MGDFRECKKMFRHAMHEHFPRERGHHKFDKRCEDFCKNRQKYKEKRAVIIKKQEEVLEGDLGQIVFAEVTLQN